MKEGREKKGKESVTEREIGASQVALVVKNPPASAEGDAASIPGSGRSSGDRNDNPFQYSSLGNPMDRGALWSTVCGVPNS